METTIANLIRANAESLLKANIVFGVALDKFEQQDPSIFGGPESVPHVLAFRKRLEAAMVVTTELLNDVAGMSYEEVTAICEQIDRERNLLMSFGI